MATKRQKRWNEITYAFDAKMMSCETQPFHGMVSELFAIVKDGKPPPPYERRPHIGLRLPHGDYTFVTKPQFTHSKELNCNLLFAEAIHDDHGKSLCMKINERGEPRLTSWYYHKSADALENLVEMINYFVIDPHTVIARNKDHCAICGRGLSDQVSRDRGIGPECLQNVSQYLVTLPAKKVELWRSIDEGE